MNATKQTERQTHPNLQTGIRDQLYGSIFAVGSQKHLPVSFGVR